MFPPYSACLPSFSMMIMRTGEGPTPTQPVDRFLRRRLFQVKSYRWHGKWVFTQYDAQAGRLLERPAVHAQRPRPCICRRKKAVLRASRRSRPGSHSELHPRPLFTSDLEQVPHWEKKRPRQLFQPESPTAFFVHYEAATFRAPGRSLCTIR